MGERYGNVSDPLFLAVAEELNFTRAAGCCNVSQPSLTRAIKLPEKELGGPLFHRERANTHLSELGRMVRSHLAHVYEQAQEQFMIVLHPRHELAAREAVRAADLSGQRAATARPTGNPDGVAGYDVTVRCE